MARDTSSETPEVRLIKSGEVILAATALLHITSVIVMREFFPTAHDVWIAVTDLFTRAMALFVAVIDGHSSAYRPVLTGARIEEMRAIYASNRLFALAIIAMTAWRTVRHAEAYRWYVWVTLHLQAKTIFWVSVCVLPAVPIAVFGLFFGYADQNFFEFQLGVDIVAHDAYYYLDFLFFLIIGWQFLYFIPATAYLTGKVAYGNRRPKPS